MKKFNVTITETLEKVIEVEASCRDEAEALAKIAYRNEDHVLDAGNFTGVKFTAQKEREHELER